MQNLRIKKNRLFLFVFSLVYAVGFAFPEAAQDSGVIANAQMEMGIDSLQQKYLKPFIGYDFPLRQFTLFGEVMFYQRAGDQLQGAIDFWLNMGVKRNFSHSLTGEFRLNHMCRHLGSMENQEIFNLNEVLGRVWYWEKGINLALGCGTYIGGNQDYESLVIFNCEFPRLFKTELSFKGEFKFRDFSEILYEAELFFSLNRSTDLFIRNAKHYDFENTTFIGIRMKTEGEIEPFLDSLKLSTGIYTRYENHKVLVEGQLQLEFFQTDFRRILFSLDFSAPIIRDIQFWGDFYPEMMSYLFNLEYERKLGKKLFLVWYSRYGLTLPLDTPTDFFSDLGTGIGFRNQPDFDRLDEKIRFEISAGYNFDLVYDFQAKFGFNLIESRVFGIQSEVWFKLNSEKIQSSIRFFLEFGNSISIRPFVRFDQVDGLITSLPSEIRFLVGVNLVKWLQD